MKTHSQKPFRKDREQQLCSSLSAAAACTAHRREENPLRRRIQQEHARNPPAYGRCRVYDRAGLPRSRPFSKRIPKNTAKTLQNYVAGSIILKEPCEVTAGRKYPRKIHYSGGLSKEERHGNRPFRRGNGTSTIPEIN